MEDNSPSAFGTFRLSRIQARLLAFSQHRPPTWLGRRLALLVRKLVLKGRSEPIDAIADGFRMRAHVTDNVSERKFLFMPQFCDRSERDYLSANLTPDGVFLDVGANAGIYTLTAARRFSELGGNGYVLAVEANPTMQARLSYNVALNKLEKHVHMAPFALSDRNGEVAFSISDQNLGESGLLATGSKTIQIPAVTLASLLDTHGIKTLDGMKIDVEGAEDIILVPFLRGATRAQLPAFIIIENSADRWHTDLLGLLSEVGYEVHMPCKMNLILRLMRSDHQNK